MSLKKYEVFIKACECKSISEAAKQFGNTQSGATQLLNSLEKELGFRLLIRNKGGVRLTDEGRVIYSAIKRVVEDNERVKEIASEINEYGANTIRIGAFKSIAVNFLPNIMKEFGEKYPQVNFVLFDGCYSDIEDHLNAGDIDVGFVSMPANVDCRCVELLRDELFAVLPQSHRLAENEYIPAEQFGNEAVVSLIDSTDRDVRRYLEAHGVRPDIRFKTADDYAMLSMVENELGICIAHELVVKNDNHRVLIKKLMPEAFRVIGLAIADSNSSKELVEKFVEFVISWFTDLNRKNTFDSKEILF